MKSSQKVKSSSKKRNFPRLDEHRPSIQSNFSAHITEETLNVWKSLPDEVKFDPSLVSFKRKNEKLLGAESVHSNGGQCFADNKAYLNDEASSHIEICVTKDANDSAAEIAISAENVHKKVGEHKKKSIFHQVKILALLACWITFTVFLTIKDEKDLEFRKISVLSSDITSYAVHDLPSKSRVKFLFEGAFLSEHYDKSAESFMTFFLSLDYHGGRSENITQFIRLPVAESKNLDEIKDIERSFEIELNAEELKSLKQNSSTLKVNFLTDVLGGLAVNFAYDPSPLNETLGVIFAAVILVGLYGLIIWELVHRTFAAIMAAIMAIGVLAAMNEKPTMETIITWVDFETLLLLFGMMLLVAVLSQTGVFDYLAVYAFKITKARVWPLIVCLCLFTAILSSVLDNVTTILLMTPVTIRLCEVMELNPVLILTFSVIFSNIGGTLTPVGDPPNVIIASNSSIVKGGITFMSFTLHMFAGVTLVMVQTFLQLRFMYRKGNSLRISEPRAVQELRREITIWQRAESSLTSFTTDEDFVRKILVKKVNKLNALLEKKLQSNEVPVESYEATLQDLQAKYPIKDKALLIKSCIALVFVISFFFLHSAPSIQRLSLGYTALFGAVLLLILYDHDDMEAILAHVEWATLLFFAALFVLMEALAELGLIDWIGQQTEKVILSVGEDARLAVAILIILWVSALASAFVDNIPLTTMMVKIVISLSENEELGLPLQPLVWALAMGACLGGNGTLIGASANVVCAGVAEQYGYKFTFMQFFKVGFPVMIGGILVATGYLMVCHVLFSWH